MTDPVPSPGLSHSRPPSLVGREREQALLREHLAAALAGAGGLVLIGGEAGIGKTALAEWLLAEAARHGATVLVGRCYDLSETPPYGPWREALPAITQSPELPPLPAALDPTGQGEAVASQDALFTRAHAYLAALAGQRPLLLLLDDLHWSDPASLDLLRFLARQVAALPVLLVVTYRADELTRRHPLTQVLPLLVREARASRFDLQALPDEAVLGLVRARYALAAADERRLAAYLRERAEGHPLFVGELLRTLEGEGALHRADGRWSLGDLSGVRVPSLLRQLIEGRLDRLDEADQRLLAVAAVIGQEVPFALWAAVGEADEDGLLAVTERAVEARLLDETPDGGGVRFAHALIREALYEGTPALRRRGWHRRIGEHLAAQPAPDPDAVAYHLRQAGDDRAVEWLVKAGERAQRAYAWLGAADRYEAALALLEPRGADAGERGWLTLRLAILRRYAGARRALGHAEEAARLAGEAGDRLLAALATFLAGLVRGFLGEPRRGIPEMQAGLDALAALPAAERVPPGAAEPLDPARPLGTVVNWLATVGRYAEARALGERYLAGVAAPTAADWLGDSPDADAHGGLAEAYAALGQPERAGPLFARARELNRAVGHRQQVAAVAEEELRILLARYRADRPAELRRLADEAEQGFAQAGGAMLAMPRFARLSLLVIEGRWAEARRVAEAVRHLAVPAVARLLAASWLGPLARAQGEAPLAWRLVGEALPAGPATAPGDAGFLVAQVFQRLAAGLALDAGDLPAARAWLAAHDRWLAWAGAVLGQAEGQLGWAAYHRAAEGAALARQHAERALAHATEPRQPLALLAAHRTLGELAVAAGRHDDAAGHLEEALALAEACAAPYERALSLLSLAELRAATGDQAGARVPLEEARGILADLEARPALDRADALASRLAGLETARETYPAGLSAREAEVLRLVAEGLTDAQVAERLFVSRHTVNAHLRAIYGKLGVTTRTAAARFATEHGLA